MKLLNLINWADSSAGTSVIWHFSLSPSLLSVFLSFSLSFSLFLSLFLSLSLSPPFSLSFSLSFSLFLSLSLSISLLPPLSPYLSLCLSLSLCVSLSFSLSLSLNLSLSSLPSSRWWCYCNVWPDIWSVSSPLSSSPALTNETSPSPCTVWGRGQTVTLCQRKTCNNSLTAFWNLCYTLKQTVVQFLSQKLKNINLTFKYE